MDFSGCQYIVVGAGLFGAVIAERIACELNAGVIVLEKRSAIGGHCHSHIDPDTGIECHTYGTHIFHTKHKKVWDWINKYTDFNSYRHKVWTRCGDKVYSMPVNLLTINSFYGLDLAPHEVKAFVQKEAARSACEAPANLEEKAISLVGRPLYEAFIRGYTKKQWETDPRELPPSIITRLPFRYGYECDYFTDPWQGIPLSGYSNLFKNILHHPNIDVYTDIDFFAVQDKIPQNTLTIYSGPLDRYFDYCFGRLKWRTIDLKREVHEVGDYLGTSVMNYADEEIPYTRIHEYRHLHPEREHRTDKTVIFKEFSRTCTEHDEPYYPINTSSENKRMEQYKAKLAAEKNTIIGGRLGGYAYYDMDTTILAALETFENYIKHRG